MQVTLPHWLRQLVAAFTSRAAPTLKEHRARNGNAAVVFIHGFGGHADDTWGPFPALLCGDSRLAQWDVYSLGYASSLRLDVPNLWAADPDIKTLALALRTRLSLPPLAQYQVIALVAHSMGGLVVQRAMIDDDQLVSRLSHAIFFGTPSNGLNKAGLVRWFKRQFRDMASDSTFIKDLRSRWTARFGSYPFELRVVAGDRDEFVPISSSLAPFSDDMQSVINGNHVEIVKPSTANDLSVVLVIEVLVGKHSARGAIESARLALERRQFRNVVDALLPRAETLDDAALVTLALALDGLGRGSEGLALLELRYKGGRTSMDVLGVLGGRIKRRWLAERVDADRLRARDLYMQGLLEAQRQGDDEQAYYHAINVAFLDLVASTPDNAIPKVVAQMARRALEHCGHSPLSHWRTATEAEAWLILGDINQAADLYRTAVQQCTSPRSVDSMYLQAVQVVGRTHGSPGVRRIEEAFQVPMP